MKNPAEKKSDRLLEIEQLCFCIPNGVHTHLPLRERGLSMMGNYAKTICKINDALMDNTR